MGPVVSSKRYKDNVVDATMDTANVFQLRLREFVYKDNHPRAGETDWGYIAEEVQQDVPQLAVVDKQTGEANSVRYAMVGAMLVPEVHKLREENKAQRARIDQLEAALKAVTTLLAMHGIL